MTRQQLVIDLCLENINLGGRASGEVAVRKLRPWMVRTGAGASGESLAGEKGEGAVVL